MSSVYFFLVADASAISSAPNTMSRGTFFSRARTSTSITSSRLPAATLLATYPSQFRHQPRPLNVVERQAHRLPFQLQRHVRFVAGKPCEVGSLAQRPVETR